MKKKVMPIIDPDVCKHPERLNRGIYIDANGNQAEWTTCLNCNANCYNFAKELGERIIKLRRVK